MLSHIGRSTVAIGAFAAIVLGGTWISYPRALQAQPTSSNGVTESSLIKIGFNIAPVKLNLVGKNHALVGLGSFFVNAAVGCNHCHSAGPSDEWASNPYFGKPAQINPDTYLGGGNDFGQIGPPKHPFDQGPNIISRNLQNRATCRTYVSTVSADYEDRHRLRSPPSYLWCKRSRRHMPVASFRRRSSPDNAVAVF